MYVREIEEMPDSFVINHKPVFGTFKGHPAKLDIRGVYKPFGILPLPTFITNLRIKSRIHFFFDLGDYIGKIKFLDAKAAGFLEIKFWDKETLKKYSYHSIMLFKKRLIPHNLERATTANYSSRRYCRIGWDRDQQKLSVIFNLKGNSSKPDSHAAFSANLSDPASAEITTVRPYPTKRRCSASYSAALPLTGSITLVEKNPENNKIVHEKGLAFFNIKRSYMKFRSHGDVLCGMGNVKGKNIAFKISMESHEAIDNDKYNENILFCDGQATPLPPVRITHSFGVSSPWVIQDTENMVDLTFTPLSISYKKISALVVRSVYHTIYGTFEGTLITKDGEKISFKTLAGIGEKYLLRL